MGNAKSAAKTAPAEKPMTATEIVDYIATHYILTSDFENLKKLYDKKYCDELVLLTTRILESSFQSIELEALRQRVQSGASATSATSTTANAVFFSTPDNLNRANAPSGDEKHKICIEISKFYVKIAHVFAAIMTSIQPQYQYRNAMGGLERVFIQERDRIPKNVSVQLVENNFCSKRINALKTGADAASASMPTVCDVNEAVQLHTEPGIPELEALYYDAGFDPATGEFTQMSPESQAQYASDLKLFYRVFTGKTDVPPTIQSFSQIPLHDFSKSAVCKLSKSERDRAMQSSSEGVAYLLEKYAAHLREMTQRSEQTRDQLMIIVTALFERRGEFVRIHPALTEKSLNEWTRRTRDLIVKLYLTCELDYVEGVRLYEGILETKMLETSQKQLDHLTQLEEELYQHTDTDGDGDVDQTAISNSDVATPSATTTPATNTTANTTNVFPNPSTPAPTSEPVSYLTAPSTPAPTSEPAPSS